MTHMSLRAAASAVASCLAMVLASAADGVHAQCTTCATPTVAYAPVVAAAPVVVAPRMGFFDRMRLRHWDVSTPAAAYTTAYAPTYTTAYAPAYTAAYAPAYTAAYAPAYTAAYAPAPAAYLTSYAPLQSPVAQTAYTPVAPASSCSTCTTNYAPAPTCSTCTTCCSTPAPTCSTCTASYAPTAVLSPVVVEPACTTCSAAAPCGACSACSGAAPAVESGYVGQAAYAVPAAAPAAGCASCATNSGGVQYNVPAGPNTGIGGGPATPTPSIESAAPSSSNGPIMPYPAADNGAFTAPQLLPPTNDRTASAPTVDIHTAVYRRPVGASSVSTAKPLQSAAPAVDATPWTVVTQ